MNTTPNPEAVAAAMKLLGESLTPPANTAPAVNITELIATARSTMQVPTSTEDKSIEATDPHMVNAMLARASELKAQKKAIEAEYEQITTFLKDVVTSAEVLHGGEGSIEELRVNGATVFTYKQSTSRVLNQEQVKKMFPDIEENAELWTDQVRRTALIK